MKPLKENYLNAGGFDYSALASAGLNTITSLIQSKPQKEQAALQEKLAMMSLDQKKELEIRLQNIQGEVAKMQILYEALALEKNREALLAMNKQRYIGIGIFGISFVILAIVIYKVKKQQNG